jgi:hypothetical protein
LLSQCNLLVRRELSGRETAGAGSNLMPLPGFVPEGPGAPGIGRPRAKRSFFSIAFSLRRRMISVSSAERRESNDAMLRIAEDYERRRPAKFRIAAPRPSRRSSILRQAARTRSGPSSATKLMAAAMTQSVAITCAQIATIPKNSASEASVATSSTRVRPMSLTPISVRKSTEFACLNAPFPADPWERLSFHSSRWQWKGSIARRTLSLSLTS